MSTRKGSFWTPANVRLLTDLYPDTPTRELAAKMGVSYATVALKAQALGIKKSAAFMADPAKSGRLKKGSTPGIPFKDGHTPWNKGLKGLPSVAPSTTFKPGHVSATAHPLGHEIVQMGYVWVKVREGHTLPGAWQQKHRVLWMAHHQRDIPPHHMVVFKNGDRRDFSIDNLVLRSRREHILHYSIHHLPKPLASVMMSLGHLKRKIREIEDGSKE